MVLSVKDEQLTQRSTNNVIICRLVTRTMFPKAGQRDAMQALFVVVISLLMTLRSAHCVDVCSLIFNPDCQCSTDDIAASSATASSSRPAHPHVTCTFNTSSSTFPPLFASPSVASLVTLGTLNMASNDLESLPSNFFGGETIFVMVLANNSFAIVPAALAKVRGLKTLDLSSNRLVSVGGDVLKHLPDLVKLNMSHNALTVLSSLGGDLSGGVHSLQNLQELDLAWNVISGIDSGMFASMKNLGTLNLHHNHLRQLTQTSFLGLELSLVKIDLSHNLLDDVHPMAFYSLNRLYNLHLAHNDLKHVNNVHFPDHLKCLDISYCDLTSFNHCQFSRLADLSFLGLRGNNLECTCELLRLLEWYEDERRVEDDVTVSSCDSRSVRENDWTCRINPLKSASPIASVSSGSSTKESSDSSSNATTLAVPQSSTYSAFSVSEAAKLMKQRCNEEADELSCIDTASEYSRANVSAEMVVSLDIETSGNTIKASWTFESTDKDTAIDGFQLKYLPEKGGEIIISDILPANQRKGSLDTPKLAKHFVICLDVLVYGTAVARQECVDIQDDSRNIMIGVLAGSIFLVPCVIAMLYVYIKDLQFNKDVEYEEIGEETDVKKQATEDQCHHHQESEVHEHSCDSVNIAPECVEGTSLPPNGTQSSVQVHSTNGVTLNGGAQDPHREPSSTETSLKAEQKEGHTNPAFVCNEVQVNRERLNAHDEISRL